MKTKEEIQEAYRLLDEYKKGLEGKGFDPKRTQGIEDGIKWILDAYVFMEFNPVEELLYVLRNEKAVVEKKDQAIMADWAKNPVAGSCTSPEEAVEKALKGKSKNPLSWLDALAPSSTLVKKQETWRDRSPLL